MKSTENTSKPRDSNEPSLLKMMLFSCGYFFSTFVMITFNNYVWHFYEAELGLIDFLPTWPLFMTLANVIYTIWGVITNPLIGYLTDRPNRWTRKLGYHTPWIIIGGIPTIIMFLLLFIPPTVVGAESALPIFLYYVIVVLLYDVAYSLFQTHSFGGFAAHFRGDQARRKAGFMTQIFIMISNFLVVTIWSLIIKPGIPSTYTTAALISVMILILGLVLFYPGARESKKIKERFILGHETAEKSSFFKTLIFAMSQKNFVLAIFVYFIFNISIGLMLMNAVNFVDVVLGEEQYIRSIGSIFMLLFTVLAMPLWAKLAKKIGHSNTYAIGLLLFGISIFIGAFITTALQYYITTALGGVMGAMFLIMLSPVLADTYDEIALKAEKHQQATLIGIRNIFVRIGLPIQSVIIAILHTITAFNPHSTIHSAEAILGLRIIQGIPLIFCLIGAIIFLKYYDLKGEKKLNVLKQLRAKGL